ncbi:hypothetical protein Scep_017754 [Stephania cephalantha]|uniref:Uncharacterized protein n=1 Tax=Stephania cephalantha TaxID=152367 RepID=A0AAP0IQ49_9MAGN
MFLKGRLQKKMMEIDLENEGFGEADDTSTAMVDVFFGFSGGFLAVLSTLFQPFSVCIKLWFMCVRVSCILVF